nr:hypothetical protein [Chelativorans xinjiangense]
MANAIFPAKLPEGLAIPMQSRRSRFKGGNGCYSDAAQDRLDHPLKDLGTEIELRR